MKSRALRMLYLVAFSPTFEISMLMVVFSNLIVMACTFNGMPDWLKVASEIVNITTVIVFLLEFGWKLIALRTIYFTMPWNLFDFVILFVSLIGLSLFYIYVKRCSSLQMYRLRSEIISRGLRDESYKG